MTRARMDGTTEQQLAWRILALREALEKISAQPSVAKAIADAALPRDVDYARMMQRP